MARRRDFGAPKSNPEAEAPEFDLHGETFYCIPEIQGAILLDLVDAADGEGPEQAGVIRRVLSSVLVDESLERFDTLTRSKDKFVPLETLTDIVGWLVEEYAAGGRSETEPDQS